MYIQDKSRTQLNTYVEWTIFIDDEDVNKSEKEGRKKKGT